MSITRRHSFYMPYIIREKKLLLRKVFPPAPTNHQLCNRDIKTRLLGNLYYCQCFSIACLLEFLLNRSTWLQELQEFNQLIFAHC